MQIYSNPTRCILLDTSCSRRLSVCSPNESATAPVFYYEKRDYDYEMCRFSPTDDLSAN